MAVFFLGEFFCLSAVSFSFTHPTMNLIMTKLKRLYLTYLESGHWKSLRRQAFERDGFKCARCGSTKRLQGHHRTYRKDLRSCTVDDIETICETCHSKHHKEMARLRRLNRKPRVPRRYATTQARMTGTL